MGAIPCVRRGAERQLCLEPEQLAAGLPAPLREQFTRGMVVMTVTGGTPSERTVSVVRAFARGLGVRSNIKDMVLGELEEKGLLRGAKSNCGGVLASV